MDAMQTKLEIAFRNVAVLPGVHKLVSHLAKHKVPMAIATGSKTENYLIKTKPHGDLFGLFGENVVCGGAPLTSSSLFVR